MVVACAVALRRRWVPAAYAVGGLIAGVALGAFGGVALAESLGGPETGLGATTAGLAAAVVALLAGIVLVRRYRTA